MEERAKRGIVKGAGAAALGCGVCLLGVSTGLLERFLRSSAAIVRSAPGGGFWNAVNVIGGGAAAFAVVALGTSLLLARADAGWSWRRIVPVAAVVCGIVALASGWGVAALSSQLVAASARGIASAEVVEAVARSIWARGAARVVMAAAVGLSGVALAARGSTGRRGSVGLSIAVVAAWLAAAVAQAASLGVDAFARKLAWGVYWVAGPRDVAHAVEAGLVVSAGAALCAGIVAAASREGPPVGAHEE